jgi:hypothetical protein
VTVTLCNCSGLGIVHSGALGKRKAVVGVDRVYSKMIPSEEL